jgi:hypothetical protein
MKMNLKNEVNIELGNMKGSVRIRINSKRRILDRKIENRQKMY